MKIFLHVYYQCKYIRVEQGRASEFAPARPAVTTRIINNQDHNVCNVSTMADLVFARLAGGPF